MRLEGKVAVVTGGGSGLGRAICVRLAVEGARVVVADLDIAGARETVGAIVAGGGEAVAMQGDVACRDDVARIAADTLAQFGAIDVLVNNAGITGQFVKAVEVSDESWNRVLDVNLRGVFLFCRAAIPQMLRKESGVIINVASTAGLRATSAGIEYAAAKHAVVGMTRQLAYEYGHAGIRVVAVAPGIIMTPMVANITSSFLDTSMDYQKTLRAPAGRAGQPEEVAAAVAFLACEDSSFMHGSILAVDGGYSIF